MAPMRMRRAAVFLSLALAAACSTESSSEPLNPQPLPPEQGGEAARAPGSSSSGGSNDGASLGTCSGTCCSKPAEGSPCDGAADTSCTWAVTCASGLVLPYQLTCTDGVWKLTNGCPEEGKTDSRGCPARQPESGTDCALDPNTFQCGYVLECTGYRKSALATCSQNKWQTTPLGTCD